MQRQDLVTRALPIRMRLTLWYSVLFATAALMLSSTSWWMLRHAIDATTRQDLQERVDDVREQLTQLGGSVSRVETQDRFDAIYRHRDDGKWLQIADANGAWIYRSARMISLRSPDHDQVRPGSGDRFSEFEEGSRHVRSLRTQIRVNGQIFVVEAGMSINKQLILLRRFGISLLLLTPIVLAAAIFVGHWMSRKALSPVAAIATEARRITEKNLDRRLPVSSAQDELTHLSVTLNNMLGRIDAGFRSVRDFTANASHELRTPLALLRTEAEVALLRPRSAQEYRETLEHMQSTAVGMASLIERLLTLARAEAGAESLILADVDLHALITSVFHEWLPLTQQLGIQLHLVMDTTNPAIAIGDPLALHQLLRVWLDNACKFTPFGGQIVLSGEASKRFVLLSVQDSGVGIPENEQKRIFERFYKVKRDRGRNGAGLGLSLAAWIAEQHGSSIRVVSGPGAGSVFSISLQRAARAESSELVLVAEESPPYSQTWTQNSLPSNNASQRPAH
jgi:heavy metal sensor kinase